MFNCIIGESHSPMFAIYKMNSCVIQVKDNERNEYINVQMKFYNAI